MLTKDTRELQIGWVGGARVTYCTETQLGICVTSSRLGVSIQAKSKITIPPDFRIFLNAGLSSEIKVLVRTFGAVVHHTNNGLS